MFNNFFKFKNFQHNCTYISIYFSAKPLGIIYPVKQRNVLIDLARAENVTENLWGEPEVACVSEIP